MKINGLKQYRQNKKISQSQMAEMLSVSRYQYIRMEQSETIPDKYIPLLTQILDQDFSIMTPYTSKYLQALRNIANISQKEFAGIFGVSQHSVFKQENGNFVFSYQKYKDNIFPYYKKKLSHSDILPFVVKDVPGATMLFYIDKCIILINDEQTFKIEDYVFDTEMEKIIYKISN